MLDELASQAVRLRPEFQNLSSSDLLEHFRSRSRPSFFPGFERQDSTALKEGNYPRGETQQLIESARLIVKAHRWSLLGFGEKEFGQTINWQRDPLSGRLWPLNYHADISLWHDDGSDIRVLWELNRLGHFVTLSQAYALTKDEEFAREFFVQLESWREQNPLGRGANWSCAMEVALRTMNLLAAFSLFRRSSQLTEDRLQSLLTLFEQHGAHIRRNLEFTHLATSNHYLSDVVGLLWLAIMLPELASAQEWREWALAEVLREMDKQVLADGANYEGSTGYHRFVLELFLYSFILCRTNEIEIETRYWRKLHTMLSYLQGILRPDNLAPLVGDTDGGQVLPLAVRAANEHGYLLTLGATVFEDPQFKLAGFDAPPELMWLLGDEGLKSYQQLTHSNSGMRSQGFPDAGMYVLRHDDLFLLFNANGASNSRPASHRHNDVLNIEVSAGGRSFIVDPGTYVYTADLHERQLFRSSSYHSTLTIDNEEQQSIRKDAPFVNGGEARVRVSVWHNTPDFVEVAAEHTGYERLAEAVTHRRAVTLNKRDRWWLIEDEIAGKGKHEISARFHFDAGLEVDQWGQRGILARDPASGMRLLVCPLSPGEAAQPTFESQFVSRHYGAKLPSTTGCWSTRRRVPVKLRWAIVPVTAVENIEERMKVIEGPTIA